MRLCVTHRAACRRHREDVERPPDQLCLRVDGDIASSQRRHRLLSFADCSPSAKPALSHGRGMRPLSPAAWYSRVGADQFLHVEHVAVRGILVPVLARSSRCTCAPLAFSFSQRAPRTAAGSVGRRVLRSPWRPLPRSPVRAAPWSVSIVSRSRSSISPSTHVDTAHKEARDACNSSGVAAAARPDDSRPAR